jgi:hypothetical protein
VYTTPTAKHSYAEGNWPSAYLFIPVVKVVSKSGDEETRSAPATGLRIHGKDDEELVKNVACF